MLNPVIEKIKRISSDRNLSNEALAEKSGMTVSQLELLFESDKIPSLSTLIKISRALGVRLGTFLDDSEHLGPVVTRKEELSKPATFSSQLATNNSHMDFYSLAAQKTGRSMEPFIIDISPDSQSDKVPSSHEGEEFIYVISGAVNVQYGNETYLLKTGDSIYYDSIVEHLIVAANHEAAKILAVVYAPF